MKKRTFQTMSAISIDELKRRIVAMIQERAGTPASRVTVNPSKYWLDFCNRFAYVVDLTPDSFRQLRIHTYHLTGDNYQSYQLGLDGAAFRIAQDYDSLVRGIPKPYVVDEPEDGIGFRYDDGHFLSRDSIRFQRVLRRFYDEGLLDSAGNGTRPRILEIGAGYGGLAIHVKRARPDARYFILDLPETLLFSTIYVTQHQPQAQVYVYERSTIEAAAAQRFEEFDYVFLPNFALGWLRDEKFDLAINLESLQEMTNEQVAEYLGFLSRALQGPLYSWNMDRNPKNLQLGSLSDLLAQFFSLRELPSGPTGRRARLRLKLKILASKLNLVEVPMWSGDSIYRELLCLPPKAAKNPGSRW